MIVREALQRQDGPALKEGDHAGVQFLEDSSHIKDIVHNLDCPGWCKARHTEWLEDDVAQGFIKYWITWAYTPGYLGKGTKIPEHLHEDLRRALLMQNLCEWAVIILFQSVVIIAHTSEYLRDLSSAQLLTHTVDPQAQVYQMVVAPRRRFQITNDSGEIAGTHSLFLISSPLAGNFILDPTAEQYGIPREYRFLPWSVYKQLYVIDQAKFSGAAVWSIHFEQYADHLTRSDDWEYWKSVRTVLDIQTTTWLQDCELKAVMDDEDQWKIKEEQLEKLVIDGLDAVEPGPSSW